MAGSEENKFIKAVDELLRGQVIDLTNGLQDQLTSIYYARMPENVLDYTNVVIVPKGPLFDINMLGSGSKFGARDRIYEVDIFVFHDGVDEETVIMNLSDIANAICNLIMNNNRLGGSEFTNIGKVGYDWASAETQDKQTVFSSYAVIPITTIYRR